MRKILSAATAILTFAAVMSLLTATARGAADPPPLLTPDPPRLEKRVSDLEKRVKELEATLAAARPGRAVGSVVNADPKAACVRVSWGQWSASGTCVASEGGKSLVVTNNHLFTDAKDGAGQFVRGEYPLAAAVRTLDGGPRLTGTAVDGDRDADLAFVVVDGSLPVAELAARDAAPGTAVWHKGVGSGGGAGKVLPPVANDLPKMWFASTAPSVSGDSGAGLFDPAGKLVAVNCGRHGSGLSAPQRGTPVTPVRSLLRRVAKDAFPKLAASLGRGPDPLDPPPAKVAAAPPAAAWDKPKVLNIDGVPHELRADGYYWPSAVRQAGGFSLPSPAASSCPGGNCPTGFRPAPRLTFSVK